MEKHRNHGQLKENLYIHNKLQQSPASDAFRVPLTFSCQRTITLAGKPTRLPRGWNIIFISWNMSCVITCSDFYPLSNQINLLMVINIWGIIIILTLVATLYNILVLCCLSHISGVMVSMFASSDVDHKFEHLSGQAKNNKVGFWWLVVAESG